MFLQIRLAGCYRIAAGAGECCLLLMIIYIGVLTHRMGKLKEKIEFFFCR